MKRKDYFTLHNDVRIVIEDAAYLLPGDKSVFRPDKAVKYDISGQSAPGKLRQADFLNATICSIGLNCKPIALQFRSCNAKIPVLHDYLPRRFCHHITLPSAAVSVKLSVTNITVTSSINR